MPKSTAPRIAACAFALQYSDDEIQLLPDGEFRAKDGRPTECLSWRLTPEGAARIIAAVSARKADTVVDYEHAWLKSKDGCNPAPAAGWWNNTLEYRPGEGLFAKGVAWTDQAKAWLSSKQYRFVSPVFPYDPATGEVLALLNFSLTNDPALPELTEPAIAAASALLNLPAPEPSMEPNEIMERLIYCLSLPLTTTVDDLQAKLDKEMAMIKAKPAAAAAIPDLDKLIAALSAHFKGLGAHVVALSAQSTPDPAKWVPAESVAALTARLAELTARIDGDEVERLVQAGLSDGRLPVELEGWARDLGKANKAALSAYLDKQKPIAALGGKQTDGKAPPHKIDGGTPPETRWETEWAASAALQAEFGGDKDAYLAFCKAELNGQAKIFGK